MSGRDRLSAEEIEAIVTGQHADPFAVLGDHDTATGDRSRPGPHL